MSETELSVSQQAFAQYWDNPKVQALVSFLQERSTHSLEDIASWDIYRYTTDDDGIVVSETHIGDVLTVGNSQAMQGKRDHQFTVMDGTYGHVERFVLYFHKVGDVQEGLKGWLRKRANDEWTVWEYQHTITSFVDTNTPMIYSVYGIAPFQEEGNT